MMMPKPANTSPADAQMVEARDKPRMSFAWDTNTAVAAVVILALVWLIIAARMFPSY